jgi:hypothetical protein
MLADIYSTKRKAQIVRSGLYRFKLTSSLWMMIQIERQV